MILRNFKLFHDVDIELGSPVVFIGPNNSGKTTALQALALWDIGVKRWSEKRGSSQAVKRPGVTINRRDLVAVPVPDANLLWRNLHVRDVQRDDSNRQQTENVRVEIIVEGVDSGAVWQCGLEFDYANAESFYCRPLRLLGGTLERMPVPKAVANLKVAFLPPMSGLASREVRLDLGAINVLLGEGRTAEVLRNLCFQVASGPDGKARWDAIVRRIQTLFGVRLEAPTYLPERGEIAMDYRDSQGTRLDISASGRGLQQTLLLSAHMAVNPGSVLLLDEPDAHLEILRQRQIYELLGEQAREQGSQIVIASHSEVVLNEAAERDVVVAFVGKPHRINDRGAQVLKSLREIGFDQYYHAMQTGWVLYLEGSTDLAILRAFASLLRHPAEEVLARPFASYVGNDAGKAEAHFFGLREAVPALRGYALFDRDVRSGQPTSPLPRHCWRRREIESYLCTREVLLRWARQAATREYGPLMDAAWVEPMEEAIVELESALRTLRKTSPWSPDTKVSDDFLDPLFEAFFQRLHLPDLMRKTNYHVLAGLLEPSEVDAEVIEVLDGIVETARAAAVGRPSSSVTQTTTTQQAPPVEPAPSGAVPPPGSGKG